MGQILTVRTAANIRLRQPGFAAGDYALFELSIWESFTEKSSHNYFMLQRDLREIVKSIHELETSKI